MTVSSVPAGWYDDPQVLGQLRYFDGGAWTEHAMPRPAPTPEPPVAGQFVGQGFPVAPAYAQGYQSHPPKRGIPGSVAWIAAGVVAIVLVVGVLGGMAAKSRLAAPGPDLTLSLAAPQTVVGRTVSTSREAGQARTQMTPIIATSFAGLATTGPTKLEIYGPGGAAAPVRGAGYVVLVWAQVTKPFDQDRFAKGMLDGLTSAAAGGSRQTFSEPNGGKTVCSQSTPNGGTVSMVICAWLRSATGLVTTIEYDVPVDTVLADNRAVVASMTHVT